MGTWLAWTRDRRPRSLTTSDAFNVRPLGLGAGRVRLDDGQELHRRVRSEKDLFVVEGATYDDLYDQPGPAAKAVEKLVAFYGKHL